LFNDRLVQMVNMIMMDEKYRDEALKKLCMEKDQHSNMALCIWMTPGIITILLSDVISLFPFLTSNNLNTHLTERVINIFSIFQILASHEQTRIPFVKSKVYSYLAPFLHQTSRYNEAEYLKVAALGILGCLAETQTPEIREFFFGSDVIPLCLRIMRFGQSISKTIAAYVIEKILEDADSFSILIMNNDKVKTVIKVLNKCLIDLSKLFSLQFSTHVVKSYKILLSHESCLSLVEELMVDDPMRMRINTSSDEQFRNFLLDLRRVWKSSTNAIMVES